MTAFDSALYERELNLAKDSMRKASTPEPFSTSKTSNWVARGGGLPAYIQHIAHDIMEKGDKTESQAIAIAISQVKKWAAGVGDVDAGTRAAAQKALDEWEALKAKSKGKKAVNASAVVEGVELRLAAEPEVGLLPGETPLDTAGYLLALGQARLDLAVTTFDPAKHRRDAHGRFAAALNALSDGDKLKVGTGSLTVQKRGEHLLVEKGKMRFTPTNPNAQSDLGKAIHKNGVQLPDGTRVSGGLDRKREGESTEDFAKRVLEQHAGVDRRLAEHDAKRLKGVASSGGGGGSDLESAKVGDVLYDTKNPLRTAGYEVVGFEDFQGQRGIKVRHKLDGKTSIIWPNEGDNATRFKKKGRLGSPAAYPSKL